MFGSHICCYLLIYTNCFLNWTHMCIYTHASAYKLLSDQLYFTFGSHIFSFASMITYVFLFWQTYLFFRNGYQVPGEWDTFHLATIFVLSHLWSHMSAMFASFTFFSFRQITFEIVHTSVYTENANAYDVLSLNNIYFSFDRYTVFANADYVLSDSHKYCTW